MNVLLSEFRRCGRILIHFVLALASQIVLAAVCTAVGLGLFLAGRHLGSEAVAVVGEAIILCGVGYAVWRAIVAEFIALAKIQGWGKWGRDR